jgi:hypothetical protein
LRGKQSNQFHFGVTRAVAHAATALLGSLALIVCSTDHSSGSISQDGSKWHFPFGNGQFGFFERKAHVGFVKVKWLAHHDGRAYYQFLP